MTKCPGVPHLHQQRDDYPFSHSTRWYLCGTGKKIPFVSSSCSNFVMTIPHMSSSCGFSCIPQNIRLVLSVLHRAWRPLSHQLLKCLGYYFCYHFFWGGGDIYPAVPVRLMFMWFLGDEQHSGDAQGDKSCWVEESLRNTWTSPPLEFMHAAFPLTDSFILQFTPIL